MKNLKPRILVLPADLGRWMLLKKIKALNSPLDRVPIKRSTVSRGAGGSLSPITLISSFQLWIRTVPDLLQSKIHRGLPYTKKAITLLAMQSICSPKGKGTERESSLKQLDSWTASGSQRLTPAQDIIPRPQILECMGMQSITRLYRLWNDRSTKLIIAILQKIMISARL